MEDMEARVYTQKTATICGRDVNFYLISSSIGNIAIVDYEQSNLEIKRKVFATDGSYDKAEAYFTRVCKKIAEEV